MLRRLIRGYYSLRYFPRRLFAILTQLSIQMTALEQGRAQALRQGSATLADIEAGIGAFCDDATRAMLGLDRSIAAASQRMSQVHRTLMRAEAASQQSGGTLDAMQAALKEVRAETALMRTALSRIAPTAPPIPGAAGSLRTMLDLLASVGRVRGPSPGEGAGAAPEPSRYEGGRAAVSVGIAHDMAWDLAVADHGIPVLQFDPTVAAPTAHRLFTFERIAVVDAGAGDGVTLGAALARLGPGTGSIILKLDMDLCDWSVISSSEEAVLGRFRSVTLQLRKLDRLADPAFKEVVSSALGQLGKTHLVEHARADGFDLLDDRDAMTPSLLEIQFRSKDGAPMITDLPSSTKVTALPHAADRPDSPTYRRDTVERLEAVPAR